MPRRTPPKAARPAAEPNDADLYPAGPVAEAMTAAVDEPLAFDPTATTPVALMKLPTGKLGGIVAKIATASGATIDELAASTGWQPHTIRAALSRLRRRGAFIVLAADADGRKAYRLEAREG